MLQEMVDAFQFHLAGEAEVDGHSCWIFNAEPKPGFQPADHEGRVLKGMKGRLWIDKATYQWVKVHAEVVKPVSFYGFLAKVGPGTEFDLEQEPVTDNLWLPKRFSVRVNASALGFSTRTQPKTKPIATISRCPGLGTATIHKEGAIHCMPTATETATAISPISKENAAPEVQPILDKLTQAFGKVPAFFGTMARVPEAFAHFMPFYTAVIEHGTVERKYKELAYLKASLINGCEYCFRAHSASGKKNGVTEEQIQGAGFLSPQPCVRCQGKGGAAVLRARDARRVGHSSQRAQRAEAVFQRRSDRRVDARDCMREFHQSLQRRAAEHRPTSGKAAHVEVCVKRRYTSVCSRSRLIPV